jgi:hypothetical protein
MVHEDIPASLYWIELTTDDLVRSDKSEGLIEKLLNLMHPAASLTVALSSQPARQAQVSPDGTATSLNF